MTFGGGPVLLSASDAYANVLPVQLRAGKASDTGRSCGGCGGSDKRTKTLHEWPGDRLLIGLALLTLAAISARRG